MYALMSANIHGDEDIVDNLKSNHHLLREAFLPNDRGTSFPLLTHKLLLFGPN